MSDSDYAIKVEGLGKKYRIGNHAPYARFTELLIGAAKAPFTIAKNKLATSQKNDSHPVATPSEFWALQDINFTVAPGEIVGVIGRNGAGKSTLLKLLTRITEPTTGRIRYKGRVGSLLEVGTGFHPELTGRDNIYLNGAILGMTRAEVRKKFDEIVAFSEVEKFLDTAVKHYSSGMYMRLAFAVAAHLESEILLVDEVLAVGDIEFQKKCLGKMGEAAKDGRTILFVSHNMGAISSLCSRVILLEGGQVAITESSTDAVKKYMGMVGSEMNVLWNGNEGDENIRVYKSWVAPLGHDSQFNTSSSLEVGIEGEILKPTDGVILGFTLWSVHGYELAYTLYDDHCPPPTKEVGPGRFQKRFVIPANTLAPGGYRLEFDVGIHMNKQISRNEADLTFNLENTCGLGLRFTTASVRGRTGLLRPAWAVAESASPLPNPAP